MRDWRAFVRSNLRLTTVRPGREARLIDEVAGQLEDLFRGALAAGETAEEADRRAREHVTDWAALADDLARASRSDRQPAIQSRLDAAIDRLPPTATSWRVLATLQQDVRHALRMSMRNPRAAVALVLTLTLGIGASTAIFSALHAAMFRPLPFSDPGRLVMGRTTIGGRVNPWVSAPDFYDYRDRATTLRSLSAYSPAWVRTVVASGNETESVPVMEVSWDLSRTLGIEPLLGRSFARPEGHRGTPDVVLVSHRYWQRTLGGRRGVVGSTLRLNFGQTSRVLTIIGVMPEGFHIGERADVWLPMQENHPDNQVRMAHEWLLVGRLASGAALSEAQRQVDGIGRDVARENPASLNTKGLLLTDLQEALAEGDRPGLLLLAGAVGLLLLAACADVAALLLSRGATRAREMAVRAALGATGRDLMRQVFAEVLIVSLVSGGLGVLLASWLRHLVLRLVPLDALGITTLPLEASTIAFAVIVTLTTCLLVGLAPACAGARADLLSSLGPGTRTTESGRRALAGQGLIAFQVAVSLTLLVAALLLGRSLLSLKSVDPGFTAENLLTARLELTGDAYRDAATRLRFLDDFVAELRALRGVEQASLVNYLPVVDAVSNVPVWDADHPPADVSGSVVAYRRYVLPGYFETMAIPFIAGRDVGHGDTAAPDRPPVAVVSQSLARRLFPGASAVGRRVGIFTGTDQRLVVDVIGVVGDAHMTSLANDASDALYVPFKATSRSAVRLVVRAAGDQGLVYAGARAALARRDRSLALTNVQTMEAILADSLRGFGLRMGAVALFGLSALLLALLGVYGVLALAMARRRREIGVRLAMGASRRQVIVWAVAHGMRPVVVGMALGLAGAAGIATWLRDQLFNVPPTDAVTYVTVVSCLFATALTTCLLPAWHAVRVDPVGVLKAE